MKQKVYEIDFDGMKPYSIYVEGYYAIDGVIYNKQNNKISKDEIEMRSLYIKDIEK